MKIRGILAIHEIRKEIESGEISEDLAQQEYYCSFEMGQEGSYWAKSIDKMRLNGQIGVVPWEPYHKVYTSWDLGYADPTAIIYFQVIGETVRIIDYYEASYKTLDVHANEVLGKPYVYAKHFPPHDIMKPEASRGLTLREMYRELGIGFTDSIKVGVEDSIENVRKVLTKVWIDEKKCVKLIKVLESYRQEFDSVRKVYKGRPLHDWSSHGASAMRYLATALPKCKTDGDSAERLEKNYKEAMGLNQSMPTFFRDENNGW